MVICINNQVQWHIFPINTTEEDSDGDKYRVKLGFIHIYHVKDTFNATAQFP